MKRLACLLLAILWIAPAPLWAGKRWIPWSNAAPAGPAWIDTIPSGSVNAGINMPTSHEQWADITLTAGTAKKLRIYIHTFNYASDIKLGLYNSGGTLLASGQVGVVATGYAEVTISDTAVTGATYKVGWVTENTNSLSYGVLSGSGQVRYTFSGSGSFNLLSSLPSPDGNDTRTAAVSVEVTP